MLTAVPVRGPDLGDPDERVIRRAAVLAALEHDAVDDAVTELLFDHVVLGRYHWTVVADSLAPILLEVLNVADAEDWAATAHHLLGEAGGAEPDGSRRSEEGTVFAVALIRDFLRAVGRKVVDLDRELRPALVAAEGLGFGAPALAALTERSFKDLLVSEVALEDWNRITARLVAEAREVTGPAATEAGS